MNAPVPVYQRIGASEKSNARLRKCWALL